MKFATPFNLPNAFPQFAFTPDFWIAAIAAGKAFNGSPQMPGVAAQQTICELANPAASGKTLFVYRYSGWNNAATLVTVQLDGTTVTPATAGTNLLVGGAAGVGLYGGGNQAAPTGTKLERQPSTAGGVLFYNTAPWFIALTPGHNLQVVQTTVNIVLAVNFFWVEL